jgi:hypothetical protein
MRNILIQIEDEDADRTDTLDPDVTHKQIYLAGLKTLEREQKQKSARGKK